MVVIRLARGGAKKRPFYHIVAANKRSPRDGKFIERIGYFNPIASGQESALDLDMEKLNAWVSNGAQLSERVSTLVKQWNKAQAATN
jgi:small subunit ribosomal protein S16